MKRTHSVPLVRLVLLVSLGIAGLACDGGSGSGGAPATGGGGSSAGTGGSQAVGASSADGGAGAGSAGAGSVGGSAGCEGDCSGGAAPDGGSGAGGAPACPSTGGACADCLSESCTDVYCGCYSNADCGPLVECTSACADDDDDCKQACFTSNADGISDAALVADCSATVCDASCEGGQALDDCPKCLFSLCEAEMNACFANAECRKLVACVASCGGSNICEQNCAVQHSAGVSDAQGVQQCRDASCSSECQ